MMHHRARNGIGGTVGYLELAKLHRPTDTRQLHAEIHRLRAEGLTARDISLALRMDQAAIINVLAQVTPAIGEGDSHTSRPPHPCVADGRSFSHAGGSVSLGDG